MKLYYKLAVINALTRIMIVAVFLLFVPNLIYKAARSHTDNLLEKRKTEFYQIAKKIGMGQFIKEDEDSTFADYTIFKEKYLSIEPVKSIEPDTIITGHREIEGDTVNARILKHTFQYNNNTYLLEIGESLQYVDDLNLVLSRIALWILIIVISLTVLVDLSITQYLLRPLIKIEDKLKGTIHPEKFDYTPVVTTTTDFRYLDHTIREMMRKIRNAFNIEKEFIANVSHELLTPISILQTRLENMLEAGNLNEEAEAKIIESQKTLGRLKQIVRSLLLISQVENNQAPKVDSVDMVELLKEVANEIEERLADKKITLKLELKEDYIYVPANRSLLFTMFFNLVNNAIKYNNENGGITIESEKANNEFLIHIRDTGKGIDAQNLKSIFYRFKKFNNAENESYGLGLAMVKTIADFHGMDVSVESTLGEGSTFTVSIKL